MGARVTEFARAARPAGTTWCDGLVALKGLYLVRFGVRGEGLSARVWKSKNSVRI